MPNQIKHLQVGVRPTLLEAEKANELVDALNALLRISLAPQGVGSVKISQAGVIIDLSPLAKRITDFQARLENAKISAACGTGNTVTVTVTI